MPALSVTTTVSREDLVMPEPRNDKNDDKVAYATKQLLTKFNFDPEGMWLIHGKRYDLTKFAKHHPGGEYILMLGQGRDCTELFESLHAVSNKPIRQMLDKYEVKTPVNNPLGLPENINDDYFLWEENGFYSTLKQRVKEHFDGASHKATWWEWIKLTIMMVLYIFCWTKAFTTGNIWWAVFSGILTEMIGFNLMHDSSHNAFSSLPALNYLGTLWSSWMFWNQWKWIQHHCYGHHSYTGIHLLDPDVVNTEMLLRKHHRSPMTPKNKYQKYYATLLYLFFPNQHAGQIIIYQLADRMAVFKGKLFGMPIRPGPSYVERDNLITMALSALWHIVLPLFFISPLNVLGLLFFNYTLMGISYYLNVAPNHDTIDIKTPEILPNPLKKIDWGEHQIRTTTNHSTKPTLLNKIITQLWGGMNFQIEHHLFPTISHAHYPEIAKIVSQTSKEFNIPYIDNKTWFQSLKQNQELIAFMGTAPYQRLKDWLRSYAKEE
eukprot:TRINITY_DN403_c0_g1_i2.p1 TRINITY_DN403_c0_g1~~TRINITY_DN403_c0_g1_i2.p1  ORF type:complete len:534 (-),score=288.04 TRINITY_DN403_c0_g1_i2:466-1938(-)